MKKIGVLISVLILTVILFSCSDNSDTDDNNQNPVNTADSGGVIGEETPLNELYPYSEHDFGGAAVNFLARQDGWADGSQDFDDITVESETGEVLNDAVFRSTRLVEEKYNVNIAVTYVPDVNSVIARSIRAGDDEYQVIQEKLVFMSATLATQNFLKDLSVIDSMNLDAPWYNQNAIKDLAINKKVTTFGGDMTVSDKSGVIFAVFNKKMIADYGLENPYTIVNEGKWTLDKFYELMTQTASDLNGDGMMRIQDDQWGLICEDYAGWMLSVASGNRLASLDSDGLPFMTYAAEKNVNDYERIKRILYEDSSRANVTSPQQQREVFEENRALFSIGMLSSIASLRGMEEDFGMVPLPKQDDNQQNYITSISPWVSRFLAMPTSVANPEMVGAVIDALSRESTNTVVPAYYDNLLNQKIARDEESVEMLKMIFDSVIYDIGSVFSWAGIWDEQMRFIQSGREDYLGYHERIEGRIQAELERTIEAMLSFD